MVTAPHPTYGGVDWATGDHAVCVVDDTGDVLEEFVADHSGPGLSRLCRKLIGHDVTRVAIERPDGPVVDALLEAGLEVVVVMSLSVKAFRERYRTSGAKSDRGDAYEFLELDQRVLLVLFDERTERLISGLGVSSGVDGSAR